MKKFSFLLLLALCAFAKTLSAQCPTNATFTTQLSIDTFPASHPGCTAIPGSVSIGGSNVINLDSLAGIVSIGGSLQINFTQITNLTGLSNLTTIGGDLKISYSDLSNVVWLSNLSSLGGGLEITNNSHLTSLNGLQGISVVPGTLKIGNQALTSLTGMENLTTVGGQLTLDGNTALTTLSALGNLDSVGNSISLYNNDALTNLAGLENITVIHGALNMVGNDFLSSLTGLNNLAHVDGGIAITGHPALSNLLALSNLNHIGNGLAIGSCPLLTSLAGLDSVHHFGGNLSIYTNNNLTSLAALGNINSLGSIVSIGISGNAALPILAGLESFTTCTQVVIDNNPSLTSLTGLQNITSIWLGGLVIDNNDALTSLSGLSGLTGNVGFRVDNNAALVSLDGLQGLTSVGGYIRWNPALTSLTGLNNVATISSLYIVSNNALPNLAGLNSVTNVLTVLAVQYNNSLVNLTGLVNLTAAREIWVQNNNSLQNFNGLTSFTTVGTLLIEDNNSLTSLDGLQNLTGGTPILKADLSIKNNPALASLAALEHFKSNINTVTVINNDDLSNLVGLDSVSSVNSLIINDNGTLSSLTGLGHLATIVNYLSINSNPLLVNLSDLSGLVVLCTPTSGFLSIQLNGQLEDASEPAICAYLNGTGNRVIANNTYGALSPAEVIADCNGQMLTWYRDNDSDTYGNPDDHRRAVNQPTGFVASDTDCNDSNAAINPDATEICGNLSDENCNDTLNEPITLTLTASTNASCNGAADGTIDISTNCGLSPFTFAWSNGATTEDLSGIPVGTYTVTTTDSQGLTKILTATITQSTGFTATISKTNITCNGANNGSLQANPSGLPTNYTYSWNTGATTRNIGNLSPGTYAVTITKTSSGCTRVESMTLAQPPVLSVILTTSNVKCYGGSTGKVVASASGGTGAKTYLWSTGSTASKILDLPIGTYTVTATDTKGCTASASATLTEPTEVQLSYTLELLSNGKYKIYLTGSGGVGSYRYCKQLGIGWPCNFTGVSVYSNLPAGAGYLFKVRDGNQCIKSIFVVMPDALHGGDQSVIRSVAAQMPFSTSVSPNPFANALTLTVENVSGEDLQVRVFDLTGRLVSKKTWPAGAQTFEIQSLGWPTGVYSIKILDNAGRIAAALKCVKVE